MKEYIIDGSRKFEIVDSVPAGYFIWNIGRNMVDGYLPLCQWANADPEDFSINTATLKAIKIEGAQTILAAIGNGQNTIKAMERYIKRYRNARPGTYSARQVKRIEAALPIMRKIRWN